MIVVPVLMISCQVSEKLKIGPVTAQTMIVAAAIRNTIGRPDWMAMLDEIFENSLAIVRALPPPEI